MSHVQCLLLTRELNLASEFSLHLIMQLNLLPTFGDRICCLIDQPLPDERRLKFVRGNGSKHVHILFH